MKEHLSKLTCMLGYELTWVRLDKTPYQLVSYRQGLVNLSRHIMTDVK